MSQSSDIKVYSVWFNMLPSDNRSRWPSGLLSDSRVVEFWDEGKVVGSWFARQPEYQYGGNVMWDAYILVKPGAQWDSKLSEVISFGWTIAAKRDQLMKGFLASLNK